MNLSQFSRLVLLTAVLSITGVAATPRPVQIQLLPIGSNFLAFSLAAADGQGPPPTGTLTATVDGALQAPAVVSHGAMDAANSSSATVGFSNPLSGGDHPVVVEYSGDSNYAGTSATFVKSLPKYAPTIGAPNLTATVFSVPVYNFEYSPTGSVTAQIDGGASMTATLRVSPGSPGPGPSIADFVWPLSGGPHTISVQYSGDNAFLPASQSFTIQVPISRTVQFSFTYNPTSSSISVTLTPTDGNGPRPTGTASVQVDGSGLGTSTLTAGSGFSSGAVVTLPKTSAGSHTISLQYSGDTNYAAGSGTFTFNVSRPTLSSTQGTISGTYGSSLNIQVLLNDPSGTTQGSVSLLEGSTTLAVANVIGGVATFSVRGLTAGTHSVIARFTGNVPVDDLPLPPFVISRASTQTALSGTPLAGTNLVNSVQAIVTFAADSGTGSVVFQENGSTLGSIALPLNGQVTFSTAGLKNGTHTLTASYSGDNNYLASTSTGFTFQVGPLPTTISIVNVSPNSPLQPGTTLDLTVVVSAGAGIPTGQVSLMDGGATLGTLALNTNATATFHVTLTVAGPHNLSAAFLGSPGFAASSSMAVTVNVAQLGFTTVSSASGSPSLAPGSLASAFGSGLAAGTATATLPLGKDLGGVEITVTDATGKSAPAALVFVSPAQVNFVIPTESALGPAQLKLVSGTGTFLSSIVLTAQAPALFAADASGSGVAAAFLTLAHADGTQDVVAAFQCSSAGCTTVPLSLGAASDVAELSFYGSGFDAGTGAQVRLGTMTLTPDYAAAQGQYPGLDQVNVRIPASMAGSGLQQLSVVIGAVSNSLLIEFR